jgi:NHLM bacteriocin system ABC transporter ATP-binding protein
MMPELKSTHHGNGTADRSQRQFRIDDPQSAWLVRSGFVDIFAMDCKDGKPDGVPRHMARLKENEAFFGVDLASGKIVLMAASAPSTVVERKPFEEVIGLSGPRPADRDDGAAIALFERWIAVLTAPMVSMANSRVVQRMTPGDRVEAEEQDLGVAAAENIVWAEVARGSACCVGQKDLVLTCDSPAFPITRSCWLELPKGGVVTCKETAKLTQPGQLAASLGLVGEFLARTLIFERSLLAEKERRTIELRAASDQNAFERALEALLSPLARTDALPQGQADGTEHPVFEVCAMVGRRLGLQMKSHPDLRPGKSLKNPVEAVAKASSVRVRKVLLRGKWWHNDHGPLVAFWEGSGQPVALLPKGSRGYTVYDPQTRKTQSVNEKLAAQFDAFAHTFYAPLPLRPLNGWDLVRFAFGVCRSELSMISLMSVGLGLLALLPPYLTGVIMDDVIPSASRTQLLSIVLFLFVSMFTGSLFTLVRSFATLRLQTKLDGALQAAVWDRLLGLPAQFFRRFTAGDLAQRSMGINAIRQALTGSVLSAVFSGVFSVVSVGLLFYYDWRMALAGTGLVIVAFLFSVTSGYLQVRQERRIQRTKGTLSGMVLQFITGIAKLRVSGSEARAFAVWARLFGQQRTIGMRARRYGNWVQVFNPVFPVACAAVLYGYESYLSRMAGKDALPTGQFLAFMATFMQFLVAVLSLSAAFMSVLGIVPLYERAVPILKETPEVDPAKSDPGHLTGSIEVNHVQFGYSADGPLALNDVSLRIKPGEFVAIVGPSGSGKSTLFRLLLGFEAAQSGSIYYDGKDLATLDVQLVRQQMGVVLQGGVLMRGSLYMNILGSLPLTIDDAWRAARMAAVERDIREMPMGMHTVVSEGGGGLSGGQKQRVMIARAVVRNPRILLFDEATSALDNETQAVVNSSLESLQTTRIVVAHRLSTIRRADCIYVLSKGRLVQQGTFDELVAQDGVFRDMARRQMV